MIAAEALTLAVLILLAATLYSSVGHAGASTLSTPKSRLPQSVTARGH
jgi:hypothetical protein